jgi:translation elongation factor EF-1alpha
MGDVWVTNGSTSPEPVVNSLNAACEEGYVPDTLHLLANPKVTDQVEPIRSYAESIVMAYDGDNLDVRVTTLDTETDFGGIVAYYRDAIENARNRGEQVAVDVTPGRKYMSAIAFQAGIQFEADHVFYLLVESTRYYNHLYPEIPRTGLDLIDFAEELV